MRELPKSFYLISSTVVIFTLLLFWLQLRHNRSLFHIPERLATDTTDISFVPIFANDPILGSPQAAVTIVAFEDFLCEHCRAQNILLNQLLTEYEGHIKVVWKDLSITTIPQSSELIHTFGYCMARQGKFEVFKNAMFQNYIDVNQTTLQDMTLELGANANKLTNCLASGDAYTHLDKNKQLAKALNIQSVPTFFVNDMQIIAPDSIGAWQSIINGITTANNQ